MDNGNAQVPNHMVGAILSTIFCCLIGGIVSIVYASQVNTKLAQGDIAGAQEASRKANGWITANVVIGIVLVVINIIVTAASM
ncbi:MAG: CD225/dispanin family protein [Kiritimatiellae bacterium]|nr:CD225/dispanin family protein [Kiritimatiellia bacterium]